MNDGYIPVVNMGKLGLTHQEDPTEIEWKRVGREITEAFRNIGFVYLSEHGIPYKTISNIVKAGASFFDLPIEVKHTYNRDPEKQQGYVAVDREKFYDAYTHELRESYDFKRLDGMFPDEVVPNFRPSAEDFQRECLKLTDRLLIALALGSGLDRNFFINTHRSICSDDNASAARLLHYPPVPSDVKPGTTRCGVHTDYGTITLLFQDDMGGLQVRDRNGKWINADPIPGTILINVGDLLQFWTNGDLVATEHRVLIPQEEIRRGTCRRSTVFFIHPDDPVLIKPFSGSNDSKPVTAKEHVRRKFRETYSY